MKKIIFISLAFFSAGIISAQEKAKDTLSTDEIMVVKPYTPTISDAFKIKDNPKIEEVNNQKDTLTYSFFSVPVASTFTPTKGKAQSVVREPLDKIYENFVAVGFGNYTTPYLEAFLHSSSSRSNDFGAFIKHQSSAGGIKDILVDDNYSDSKLSLFYKQFERDYNWEANLGAQHQIYNWYGLPEGIAYDPAFLSSMDSKQTYLNIFGGGSFKFEDAIFKGGKLRVDYFSDNYNSSEIQVKISPEVEFPISSELINLPFDIEFITGSFKENYITNAAIEYSFVNLGTSPSLEVLRDKLTVNLGARVYYSFDLESKQNKFYAYPNVTASYKIVDETVIGYAGVTGDLHQNSYREFANDNPFVSPTLNIQPTDQQYNVFLGAKGKLSSKVGYNFKASYQSEKNKALYVQNPTMTDGITNPSFAYQSGNSFNVVYDKVTTLSVFAEFDIYISKEFKFGGNIEYNNLETDTQEKAWYTPTLKGAAFANYNAKKWYVGADLYFVGEQFDLVQNFGDLNGTVTSIDPYVDLNFNGGYVFTDRLTAFGRVNNVLGINYNKYTNYKVQGIQVLAGVIYKFDF
ncbi:MAG: TonB-dependent receptor [Flavobacteriaceae bacterium]|nr:MAG: TonB-dependent receptor [Flavobacteriaceae bacterium]